MKRKLFVVTAALMAVIMIVCALGSCSIPFFGGEEEKLPDISVDDVFGTWERISDQGKEVFIFTDNMKYTQNYSGAVNRGTFSVSGNEITTVSETGTTRTHVTQFSEDKNTMSWGSGSFKVDYTRKK